MTKPYKEHQQNEAAIGTAVNDYYKQITSVELKNEPGVIGFARKILDRVKEVVTGGVGAGIGFILGKNLGRLVAASVSTIIANPGPSILYEKVGAIATAAAGAFAGFNIAGRWRERRLRRERMKQKVRAGQFDELFREQRYRRMDLENQKLQLETALLAKEVLLQQQYDDAYSQAMLNNLNLNNQQLQQEVTPTPATIGPMAENMPMPNASNEELSELDREYAELMKEYNAMRQQPQALDQVAAQDLGFEQPKQTPSERKALTMVHKNEKAIEQLQNQREPSPYKETPIYGNYKNVA